MIFECPNCGEEREIDLEDLPSRACDDGEIQCDSCQEEFIFGWVADIEIRGKK